MRLLKFSILLFLFHGAVGESSDEDALVARIFRDITGRYHPGGLHGEHAHAQAHVHEFDEHSEIPESGGVLQAVHVTSGLGDPAERYSPPLPPAPVDEHQPHEPFTTPNGYANCGCVPKGRCAPEAIAITAKLLTVLRNDVKCGVRDYDMCCLDDWWPGPVVRI